MRTPEKENRVNRRKRRRGWKREVVAKWREEEGT